MKRTDVVEGQDYALKTSYGRRAPRYLSEVKRVTVVNLNHEHPGRFPHSGAVRRVLVRFKQASTGYPSAKVGDEQALHDCRDLVGPWAKVEADLKAADADRKLRQQLSDAEDAREQRNLERLDRALAALGYPAAKDYTYDDGILRESNHRGLTLTSLDVEDIWRLIDRLAAADGSVEIQVEKALAEVEWTPQEEGDDGDTD